MGNPRKMSYSEDELIPLSYLSQFYYCPRRAGLMLLEQQWQDNVHTIEGTLLHERVHGGESETRGNVKVFRAVPVRSMYLGVAGYADYVELFKVDNGFYITGLSDKWAVYPVEYKHGEVRNELEYEVQLCAQAMCLETMWNCEIHNGYVYYEADKRRKKVELTEQLRKHVIKGCEALHQMMKGTVVPPPVKRVKCRECSMQSLCLPSYLKKAASYVDEIISLAEGGEGY